MKFTVPTAATGRADLVRCLAEHGDGSLQTLAGCLGLVEEAPSPAVTMKTRTAPLREPVATETTPDRSQPARFWRVVSVRYFDSAEEEERLRQRKDAQDKVRPLSEGELRGQRSAGWQRARAPKPWRTWSDYGPGIHDAIARKTGLGAIDIDDVLTRLTRCEFVDPLPRRPTLGVERPSGFGSIERGPTVPIGPNSCSSSAN